MADTTGQQSSTVAHDITRNPASIWLSPMCDETADHGEGRTWAAPAPDETCEDCSEPWVEYVRSDLASVSSASAETPLLRQAAEKARAQFQFYADEHGKAEKYEKARTNAGFAEMLEEALAASPEPVPATNQAGEVDHVLIDELRAVSRAMQLVDFHARENDIDLKPATCRAIIHDAIAALATQPATSQEEEGKLHRKLRTIYDVLHDIHDRCEDEGDRIYLGSTEDRHTLKRQLRYLEKLIPDALLYPTLASTPTPPTLSEDLREALTRRIDLIDVQAKCLEGYAESNGYSGKAPASVFHWQATHFRDLASEMRAALAQVKAS